MYVGLVLMLGQVFVEQTRQEEAVVWNQGSISGYELGLGKERQEVLETPSRSHSLYLFF